MSVAVEGFAAPGAAARTTTAGYERICMYTTSGPEPITITFASPVSPSSFTASRKAFRRRAGVVKVGGLGDAAWAAKAGTSLFVLDGSLDIVIGSPGTPAAALEALARKLV
jgi:hypothetical protein